MFGRDSAIKLLNEYDKARVGGKRAVEYLDEAYQLTHDQSINEQLPSEASAKERTALMLLPVAYHAILTWLHANPEGKDLSGLFKKKPKEEKTEKNEIVVADQNTQLTAEEKEAAKYERVTTERASDLAQQQKEEMTRGGVPETGDDGSDKNEKHTNQKSISEPRVSDYYAVLGVPPNATDEEIKSAFRKLIKEKNYDFAAGELRKQNPNITTAEIDEQLKPLTREIQDINIAYAVLNTKEKRAEYDRIYKREYSDGWDTAYSEPSGPTGFTVVATPTRSPSKESAKAEKSTKYFNDLVSRSGPIALSAGQIAQLDAEGKLPEKFQGSSSYTAVLLARSGLTPEGVLELSKNPNLSAKASGYLENVAHGMKSLQLANSKLYNALVVGSGNPTPSLSFATNGSWQNSLTIQNIRGQFAAIAENFRGQFRNLLSLQGTDSNSTSKLNQLMGNAVNKYGGDALKKLLIKGGSALATKLGLTGVMSVLGTPLAGAVTAALLWVGEKALDLFKKGVNWLKRQLGNSPEAAAAVGLGAAIFNPLLGFGILGTFFFTDKDFRRRVGIYTIAGLTFFWTAVATTVGASFVIAFLGFVLLFALVLFIINSGGYVAPHWIDPAVAGVSNAYVSVAAIGGAPLIENPTSPRTLSYTITITAKAEDLTNFQRPTLECSISGPSGTATECPTINPPLPDLADLTIKAGESHTFTLDVIYDNSYADSLAINRLIISAETASQIPVTETASTSVCIGNCPQDCPSIWPTDHGAITQGHGTTASHARTQAIDIGSVGDGSKVYATHGGIVEYIDNPSCEGNIVMIKSTCNGAEFKSRYSHLLTRNVSPGSTVQKGQLIGTTDNTGSSACSTGSHLHYELIGLPMSQPWIPEPIRPAANCCTDCGVSCTTSW